MKRALVVLVVSLAACTGGCSTAAKPIRDTANLVANKGGLAKLDIKNCRNGDASACDKAATRIDEITALLDELAKKVGKGGNE